LGEKILGEISKKNKVEKKSLKKVVKNCQQVVKKLSQVVKKLLKIVIKLSKSMAKSNQKFGQNSETGRRRRRRRRRRFVVPRPGCDKVATLSQLVKISKMLWAPLNLVDI
jgi:hypothetical protein